MSFHIAAMRVQAHPTTDLTAPIPFGTFPFMLKRRSPIGAHRAPSSFGAARVAALVAAIAAVLLPATAPRAHASDLHEPVDVGVEAFVGLGWMSITETDDLLERPLPGIGVGGTALLAVSERASLGLGLAYRVRGHRAEARGRIDDDTLLRDPNKLRLNYVSLPVYGVLHVPSGDGELRLFAGAEFGYAFGGRFTDVTGDEFNLPVSDVTYLERSDYNAFDAGPLAGFGFDFPVGDGLLGMDLRLYIGLFDAMTVFESSKHRQLSLTVTYWFRPR